MDSNNKIVAERLIQLMDNTTGLTIKFVADKVGISPTTLAKFKNGNFQLSHERLKKVEQVISDIEELNSKY